MPLPPRIADLVERFARNFDSYRLPSYKETEVRVEFIDPFFEELGWDVKNKEGNAEAYKDVVHEPALQVEDLPRAPDYSFRIGGTRKFFVEAKRPAVNLKEDPSPAFQLRRYAWSAKLPLSVLTDFQEFAVYDTRVKPERGDKASKSRTFYCTFEEYAEKWDEIAAILAKDSILKGAFDKYAESKTKRGTAEVDDAFLHEIEHWREELAKDLARRNKTLTRRELNATVQLTLDRIIFLRICEDRGIEPYRRLRDTLRGKGIYPRLLENFREADDRYNSGLFHFRNEKGKESPDRLTPTLEVGDGVLKEIIENLYYPESSYEFSVLPADILGQVYERFLGKTITLDEKHHAQVEEKPEIRKAGGVYYTPTYVVQSIVSETLGRLVSGKHVNDIAKIRVLDPACGSGSFLLVAYQFLLDWHLSWYRKNEFKKYQGRVRQISDTEWRLTTDERRRILLNNIFGVDVDPQAVEVTKLSLLLKVLEGETDESLSHQFSLAMHERALPDLAANIKHGNSVIASDFFDGVQLDFTDEDELFRINAFDWKKEFSDVFKDGGFDAVIANPPYVLLQTLNQPDVFQYLQAKFASARYKIDTYHVFVEAGLRLTKTEGFLGYIVPSSFLRNKFAEQLRKVIVENSSVRVLRVFDYPVFRNASVDTAILVAEKTPKPQPTNTVAVYRSVSVFETRFVGDVSQLTWMDHPKLHFSVPGGEGLEDALAKIERASILLGEFADAYFGIQTHDRKSYVASQKRTPNHREVVDGSQIGRYKLNPSVEYVDFRPLAIKSGGKESIYQQKRIGVRQIGKVPMATILPAGLLTLNTIYNVYPNKQSEYALEFVLAILLSKAGQAYWQHKFFDQKRTFPKIKKAALLGFPIPRLDFTDAKDRKSHDQLVKLVELRLRTESQLAMAKLPSQETALSRQVETLEGQIDNAVYALFSLSPAEIAAIG